MAVATTDYAGCLRISDLCRLYLRAPETSSIDAGVVTFNFNPALSAGEQATFDRIVKVATSTVPGITPAEWASIESDIDGLATFQALPTPPVGDPLRPIVLAIKAQNRLWKALLRS